MHIQGLGVFLPASWTLPQNPLGMGHIVPARFSLPENPIVAEILAKRRLAEELQAKGGMSCGIGDCPCQVGLCGGLGSSVDDVLKSVTSGGWQTWALVGAGILALVLFTGGGGSQRRSEITAARAKYKSEVARIRAARPRRYQRFV